MYRFDFKLDFSEGGVYWFTVKNKYRVRIDAVTGESSCECPGFCYGISKGRECKHILKCKEFIEVMREHKKIQREIDDKTFMADKKR